MPRLVLHPGFHKSGTSTAQHLLWKNRKALAPHVEVFQIRHLTALAEPAMRYSVRRDPIELWDIAALFDEAVKEVGPKEGRHILLTHEGLVGHMPGWPGVTDYSAAPVLFSYYVGYLADRFPHHEIALVLTTREAGGWLSSAWRHQLRGRRLTQDFATFAKAHRAGADLAAVVAEVRAALDGVPVHVADLAETGALPLGPGAALLAPLGLPEKVIAGLEPVAPGNRGPDAALAETFLRLNRSTLPDAEVEAEKSRLAAAAGVGGWVRG